MGKVTEDVVRAPAQPVNVAPDGDLVFLIGPDKARVRVYSLILKNASKVFSAMLGPQFSEGQTLLVASTQPTEIPLPEDDPDAMIIICRILHGRNDAFVTPLQPTEILSVATSADKWDCVVPLAWAIKDWLKCDGVTDNEELWRLMLAAYWFNNETAFETLTRALIFYHSPSYNVLEEQEGFDVYVSVKIRHLLEESRTKLRMSLIQSLVEASIKTPVICQCGYNGKACIIFIQQQRNLMLEPKQIFDRTLSGAFEAAEKLVQPKPQHSGCQTPSAHSTTDLGAMVRSDLKRLREERGISLKSLRT